MTALTFCSHYMSLMERKRNTSLIIFVRSREVQERETVGRRYSGKQRNAACMVDLNWHLLMARFIFQWALRQQLCAYMPPPQWAELLLMITTCQLSVFCQHWSTWSLKLQQKTKQNTTLGIMGGGNLNDVIPAVDWTDRWKLWVILCK